MSRPSVLNALDSRLRAALDSAFRSFDDDDELLVAVLKGDGNRSFSVGADMKEMSKQLAESHASGSHRPVAALGQMVGFDAINVCSKPVIASIDGYCLGGGLELALYCDIRAATHQSTFGLPEPRISRLGGPGLHNLSRMIPLGEALRMQLTGGTIDAVRAYQIGLVQELADDASDLARKIEVLTDEIKRCAPLAVRAIKRIVRVGRNLPVEYSWLFGQSFAEEITRSDAAVEGASAFINRRRPNWQQPQPEST
jgi:enoyl-CoA hydratase/carnithine racemase